MTMILATQRIEYSELSNRMFLVAFTLWIRSHSVDGYDGKLVLLKCFQALR